MIIFKSRDVPLAYDGAVRSFLAVHVAVGMYPWPARIEREARDWAVGVNRFNRDYRAGGTGRLGCLSLGSIWYCLGACWGIRNLPSLKIQLH